jgi:hypothetical protein
MLVAVDSMFSSRGQRATSAEEDSAVPGSGPRAGGVPSIFRATPALPKEASTKAMRGDDLAVIGATIAVDRFGEIVVAPRLDITAGAHAVEEPRRSRRRAPAEAWRR